jgi:hypothetical protein
MPNVKNKNWRSVVYSLFTKNFVISELFYNFCNQLAKFLKMSTVRLLGRATSWIIYRHLRSPVQARMVSSETLTFPQSETTPPELKEYPEKIVSIVNHISQLTLLEVADLNELLKTRLKITDAPVMMSGNFGGAGPGAGAAAPVAEEEEEAAPAVAVQVDVSFIILL